MNKFRIYKEMIDIDYYIYFSKAYFAYNAYLKAHYPRSTDLDKNKSMKENLPVRNKFRYLVENGKHFKDDIIALRDIVGQSAIPNNGDIINFDKVKIGEHQVVILFNESYNGVQYFIKAIDSEKFTFTVGTKQSNPFVFENLETELVSTGISTAQQNKVRSIITAHVQSYTINLSIEIEKLKNIDLLNPTELNDLSDILYKGFVEIIYKLRNALFHSEVEPNHDVMRVYKYAYFILRKLVKEIPST